MLRGAFTSAKPCRTSSSGQKTSKSSGFPTRTQSCLLRTTRTATYLPMTFMTKQVLQIETKWLFSYPTRFSTSEFETILTSVELEKTLGRSKRMILPEDELERIKKILQRAVDKAAGKLDLSDLLTEDNPDGREFFLKYYLMSNSDNCLGVTH